jgi:hypothetical protein
MTFVLPLRADGLGYAANVWTAIPFTTKRQLLVKNYRSVIPSEVEESLIISRAEASRDVSTSLDMTTLVVFEPLITATNFARRLSLGGGVVPNALVKVTAALLPDIRAFSDPSGIGPSRTGIFGEGDPPKSKELASCLASSRLTFLFSNFQRYCVRDADAVSGAAVALESVSA